MRRGLGLVAELAAVAGATAVVGWLLLDPAPEERAKCLVVLLVPVLAALAVLPLLRRWVASRGSVAGAATAVGLSSLLVGTAASAVASKAMFLSGHDFRLFVVLLGLAGGIALVVGRQLAAPIASDVRRLGVVAEAVAAGDLTQRTGLTRRDELGRTAEAIDRMVGRLADAEREREALAGARQHLLSGLSHDLRTPLAAVRAAVESVQDGMAPDPDRYLTLVRGHLDTMEHLLGQLMQFARIEAGQLATERVAVSLAELVDEAVEALSPLAGRHGVSLTATADGPGVVTASPSELARVLRNLLDNAIRHCPPNDEVHVSVQDGAHVRLVVRDAGPGFPDDFRDHAFEPFTRADPARSVNASGLGLAIARALIEAHDGTIALGPGPGGEVVVELRGRRHELRPV
jgi:two-component system, OmpR family, sensor histidine kinase BaeS